MKKRQCGRRFVSIALAALLLYFFILSIVILKEASFEIGKGIFSLDLTKISALNAFGLGWLFSIILQSSGTASASLAALNAGGLIAGAALIFMVLGTRVGTSITSMIVSLFSGAKKRRDFRHGFEIAIANLAYVLPIVIILFLLEFFFHIFSAIQIEPASLMDPGLFWKSFLFSFFSTKLMVLGPVFALLIAFFLMIMSLRFLPKQIRGIFGEENTRKVISRYIGNKYSAFFVGLILTFIFFSTSITVSLLIPFVISRFINLRKIIPYLIGANLGGISDFVIAGIVIGKTAIPAIIAYSSVSILGLLWLVKTDWLFSITKFISKRVIKISKKRAIVFVILFILLALLLAFI